MDMNNEKGNKILYRFYHLIFWSREYRRQAILLDFHIHPEKQQKYLRNLKDALGTIFRCYAHHPENFISCLNNFSVLRKISKTYEVSTINIDSKEILYLSDSIITEFLLEELSKILFSMINPLSCNVLNKPERLKRYTQQLITLIDLLCKNRSNIPSFAHLLAIPYHNLCSFKLTSKNHAAFSYLSTFHKKNGILPEEITFSKMVNISFYNERNSETIQTQMQRIFLDGLSGKDLELAVNTALFDFDLSQDGVCFIVGSDNFKARDSNYKYLYLHHSTLELDRDSLKNKLEYCLRQRPTGSKEKRVITNTPQKDTLIQVKFKANCDIKLLHGIILNKLQLVKELSKIEIYQRINQDRIIKDGKYLKRHYPFTKDANEQGRIDRRINPENLPWVQNTVCLEQNGLAFSSFEPDAEGMIYFSQDNLIKQADSTKLQLLAEHLAVNEINTFSDARNGNILLTQTSDNKIAITCKHRSSSIEGDRTPRDEIISQNNEDYTPHVHEKINLAKLHNSLNIYEKNQVTCKYYAVGFSLWQQVVLDKYSLEDAVKYLQKILGKHRTWDEYFLNSDVHVFKKILEMTTKSIVQRKPVHLK